ncbi:MAG: hypothetical protein ACM3ZE_11430 [Myxococcales bacterium]
MDTTWAPCYHAPQQEVVLLANLMLSESQAGPLPLPLETSAPIIALREERPDSLLSGLANARPLE